MNIYVWKKLRNYMNPLENVMTNNNISSLSNQTWPPILKDLLTTVQYQLDHL